MNLVIDVGNTTVVVGIFKGNDLISKVATDIDKVHHEEEYFDFLKNFFMKSKVSYSSIEKVLYSSVVPNIDVPFTNALSRVCDVEIKQLASDVKRRKTFEKMPYPEEIGDDLIADVFAGISCYEAPMLIIDLGTASKVLYIDENKQLISVNILPGLIMSKNALSKNTSLLPEIDLGIPNSVFANTTDTAMRTGVILGHIGSIDGIVDLYKKETKNDDLKVIVTGGISSMLQPLMRKDYLFNINLNLQGLNYILEELL